MRKKFFFFVLLSVFMLTGCSNAKGAMNEFITDYVIQHSEIADNDAYQKMEELKEKGELNADGEYDGSEQEGYQMEEAGEQEEKQVRITIADNGFLDIRYFYDAELTENLGEDASVFLNPGEKLYCSLPESRNAFSNTYLFSEFQIYEYDFDGSRGELLAEIGADDLTDNLLLEIPQDYEGAELAIFPLGKYEKPEASLYAFYYDENGKEKEVFSGSWKVNGAEVNSNDNTTQFDASGSYKIEYTYDAENYYYAGADPATPYAPQGSVTFEEGPAADQYRVQLHPYIAFSFEEGGKEGLASVTVNDGQNQYDEEETSITKLRAGDVVTVETKENYRIFCKGHELKEPEKMEDGYRYTIPVPETNEKELDFMVFKSQLKVVLDASVGQDMQFDVTASGINKKNLYYRKQSLNQDDTVCEEMIGIEEKISIAASLDGGMDTDILKVAIEKVDGNGNKTKEIQYIEKLPGNVDIALYSNPENITGLNKIYKSVSVKISRIVSGMVFHERTVENGTVSVKLADDSEAGSLLEGDLAEESQKVIVTIIPDEGYYVSGKDTKNYEYRATMKLSKYETDIDKTIKTHKIKKLYQVTLNKEDAYGVCTYKLNGKVVSGTIDVREEDELVLEYEITEDAYRIMRESEGFWEGINAWRKNTFSKKKEKITIPILSDIDGTIIERGNYIKVTKGE